jgi:hypothetical protein
VIQNIYLHSGFADQKFGRHCLDRKSAKPLSYQNLNSKILLLKATAVQNILLLAQQDGKDAVPYPNQRLTKSSLFFTATSSIGHTSEARLQAVHLRQNLPLKFRDRHLSGCQFHSVSYPTCTYASCFHTLALNGRILRTCLSNPVTPHLIARNTKEGRCHYISTTSN